MNRKSFITRLIVLILVLVVGIPVILGVFFLLLMGLVVLFALLVVSIGMISAPAVATVEPSVAMIIQGIPEKTIVLLGVGFVFCTLGLFILYIFFVKQTVLFLIDMVRRILGQEVRRGKKR
ncbi:hypothetical protein ABB02_01313 [Clostridiaceae bacterium JG1575]|nr:hypothetical protein ABB02_01313 [Clostridiaceae bacterium JG1575]